MLFGIVHFEAFSQEKELVAIHLEPGFTLIDLELEPDTLLLKVVGTYGLAVSFGPSLDKPRARLGYNWFAVAHDSVPHSWDVTDSTDLNLSRSQIIFGVSAPFKLTEQLNLNIKGI